MRLLNMTNNVTRCARCILPDSFPGLTFDRFGICNKCHTYVKRWANQDFEESEKSLRKILEDAKRKRRKYDCIVGLSGGKDSSYVAYLCARKYQLNALYVTFDNGFLSAEASENIEKLVEKLGLTHITDEPNWGLMKRLYRHFLFTTGEFCTPCNVGINSTLYKLARGYKAPLIISGYSARTDSDYDINVYHVSPEYFMNVVRGHFLKDEIEDFLHCKTMSRAIHHLSTNFCRKQE